MCCIARRTRFDTGNSPRWCGLTLTGLMTCGPRSIGYGANSVTPGGPSLFHRMVRECASCVTSRCWRREAVSNADMESPPTPTAVPRDEGEETPETARRRSVVRVIAELACLLCGRGQGLLEATTWPPTGPVRLHAMPGCAPVRLEAAARLHCGTCGGSVVTTEVSTQRIWIDVPVDWHADRPRRGRPPKWLVAQRDGDSAA